MIVTNNTIVLCLTLMKNETAGEGQSRIETLQGTFCYCQRRSSEGTGHLKHCVYIISNNKSYEGNFKTEYRFEHRCCHHAGLDSDNRILCHSCRHHLMFAHLRYPWNKILFMEFSEMVCHFPSRRHRFGHLYYYSDYIHITTSNF